MVLAGGRVGELSVLTLERPKSALPFAGHFRIIDFPLSNISRAGINNVGILSQYRPATLIDHIGVGEPWDFVGLDRGAKILPPYHAADAMDWYRGNADAVYQNLVYLKEHEAEVVLIVSGDHIYSMDYRSMILEHLEKGADLTIALKRIPTKERRFGYGLLDADGNLVGYEEKPAEPRSDLVSLTIYVFQMHVLEEVLLALKDLDSIEFGRDVIPSMMGRYHIRGYLFDGYWAYTRTVDTYYEAHEDVLNGRIDIESWQVRTNNIYNTLDRRVPPIFRPWTRVEQSLVSEGCLVDGLVDSSVLGPGVVVARDGEIRASILYSEVRIGKGARVEKAILDEGVEVGEGAIVGSMEVPPGGTGGEPQPVSKKGITLIGKGAKIEAGARVPAGSIVEPGSVVTP